MIKKLHQMGSVKTVFLYYFALTACLFGLPTYVFTGTAYAQPVPTEQFFDIEQQSLDVSEARARVKDFLSRDSVREMMIGYGVSDAEALARVDSLTDQEAIYMASMMDQLPAGGDTAGAVLGTLLVVFLVLLLTDILGFTNVFPFTRR